MENTFTIEEFTKFDQNKANEVRVLAKQLSSDYKELSDQDIKSMLDSPCNSLFLVMDQKTGKTVAMATLITYRIPFTKKSILEDVVVDEAYRGRGVGSLLMTTVIERAKKDGSSYIDLTSRPTRVEGNKLYQKFNFQKRDTNVYRLVLS